MKKIKEDNFVKSAAVAKAAFATAVSISVAELALVTAANSINLSLWVDKSTTALKSAADAVTVTPSICSCPLPMFNVPPTTTHDEASCYAKCSGSGLTPTLI